MSENACHTRRAVWVRWPLPCLVSADAQKSERRGRVAGGTPLSSAEGWESSPYPSFHIPTCASSRPQSTAHRLRGPLREQVTPPKASWEVRENSGRLALGRHTPMCQKQRKENLIQTLQTACLGVLDIRSGQSLRHKNNLQIYEQGGTCTGSSLFRELVCCCCF